MKVLAYLNFDGNTREAMTFYSTCLGAKLEMITFADHMGAGLPQEMAAAKDRIMHANLSDASGSILMASDLAPGMTYKPGANFSVSIHCDSAEQVDRFVGALGEGGKIGMPAQDTSWGARYGNLTDKFGIQWMFNFQYPPK